MRNHYAFVCFLILASLTEAVVADSPLVVWDYKTLTERSEVVVIATPKESISSDLVSQDSVPRGLIKVGTRIEVSAVLKGSSATGDLIFHHIYDPAVGSFRRSPGLSFSIPKVDEGEGLKTRKKTYYLIFLQPIKDRENEFQLTSGPWHEVKSVTVLRKDF